MAFVILLKLDMTSSFDRSIANQALVILVGMRSLLPSKATACSDVIHQQMSMKRDETPEVAPQSSLQAMSLTVPEQSPGLSPSRSQEQAWQLQRMRRRTLVK